MSQNVGVNAKGLVILGMGLSIILGGFITIIAISPHTTQSTQNASATIDYFSWSCQQLENQSNAYMNNPDFYYSEYGLTPLAVNPMAGYLLQIMQLKGCVVSP